jgi:glycosyltransferase involved in cell wall biosynthesis
LDTVKLNLCAIGDARSPKTWSGTPFSIYNELKKSVKVGAVIDAGLPLVPKAILYALSSLLYGTTFYARSPIVRYPSAAISMMKLRKMGMSNPTLHFGTFGLPYLNSTKSQKNYLICDYTWNLLFQNIRGTNICSNRLSDTFDRLEHRAYCQVNHIFSISEYVKKNLIDHYGIPDSKITVTKTGLGIIKPFYKKKSYTNKKILFAAKGRFKEKGGELVVASFNQALRYDSRLHLTIVGCDEAQRYKRFKNVTFKGFIPKNELQSLFNTHSLFIMPAYREPWGLSYLEAMACKMPILGLRRNSFPEISCNGKYGFIIEKPDPGRIAKVLVDAFANPKKLESIGIQAQEYCLRNYSWAKTVDTILNVIEDED